MSREEIIEGNKLIAEFMGVESFPENKQVYNVPKYGAMSYTEFKYHLSWDWLMPVVEKIEAIGWNVNINKDCAIYDDSYKAMAEGKIFTKVGLSKKEAIWLAVIEFIKGFNQQPLKTKEHE